MRIIRCGHKFGIERGWFFKDCLTSDINIVKQRFSLIQEDVKDPPKITAYIEGLEELLK